MSVNADQLKAAFGYIVTKAEEAEEPLKVIIDLEKIADAIVSGTADLIINCEQDSEGALTAFEKSLNEIEGVLSKAECGEDDVVFVATNKSDSFSKGFSIEVAKEAETPEEPKDEDAAEEDEESTDSATEETQKFVESDEGSWSRDMAPAESPVARSSRLTKRELPVNGRGEGIARNRREKHREYRDRQLSGQRSMS